MSSEKPYEKAAEEAAKAVQKVAGVADKTLDTANSLGGFLKTVLGPGITDLGGAFADWAAVIRLERAHKLADRVCRLHLQRGIEGRTTPIPARLAIPLLQQSTLEDDGTLLDMWAGLIANATDPERRVEARRSFCSLLSSMEPLDALALVEIEKWRNRHPERRGLSGGIADQDERAYWPNLRKISETLTVENDDLSLSLENLERLGLIFDFMPNAPLPGADAEAVFTGIPVPVTHEHAMLDLTHTGIALLKACSQ